MANEWYFSWGEHNFGPYSPEELKALATIGRLQPTDLVWKDGMTVSVVAARVKHLFRVVVPPPCAVAVVVAEVVPPPILESSIVAPFVTETVIQQLIGGDETIPLPEDLPPVDEPVPEDSPGAAPADEAQAETAPPVVEKPKITPPVRKTPKGTARVVHGAVIVAQDGKTVQYRRKCTKCGHEDTSRQSAPIHNGSIRSNFFCPKCRKSHTVELQGMVK